MNTVLVFKTSVANTTEAQRVKPLLDELCRAGGDWSFDLEEREKILRVADAPCDAWPVIGLLRSMGYQCEELND